MVSIMSRHFLWPPQLGLMAQVPRKGLALAPGQEDWT
jgi:hypothetical protein